MARDPRAALEAYVAQRFGVAPGGVASLGGDGGVKELGYGKPVRVSLGGTARDLVVHRSVSAGYGHDTLSDHAAEAFFAFGAFSRLPSHVPAVDVGVVREDGSFASLADARDFFYVTEFAEGTPYFHDLDALAQANVAAPTDLARAEQLARYLASIHADKRDAPELWRRRVRDLFGHHECLSGLLDSYDAFDTEAYAPKAFLEELERRAVAHRHRLKPRVHRLSVVHGDFHPWNILFDGDTLRLLDRSRGELGEPADDLAALAVNYVFFSLRAVGRFEGGFRALWDRFFATYLERTGDQEVLETILPFLAWRALVVASPAWYPHIDLAVRRALFRLVDRVLGETRLDLDAVARWVSP